MNVSPTPNIPTAVDLDDAAVVAEYCYDTEWPIEDHFIAIVDSDGSWRQWPVASTEGSPAQRTIEQRIGCSLVLKLGYSDVESSRVLWPKHLAGRPLFHTVVDKRNGLRGLMGRLLGIESVEFKLSRQVHEYLQSRKSIGLKDPT